MADLEMLREGFGQVEPNHLSAHRNGQVYAQLPCAEEIEVLENGQFVKYNYVAGQVDFSDEATAGEWMLVYNEVKTYEPYQTYKDFALQKKNYTHGIMTPRVFKTHVGDIYTTNCFAEDVTEVSVGDTFAPNAEGFLAAADDGDMLWAAVKCYTMPDGQPGVKLQRVK